MSKTSAVVWSAFYLDKMFSVRLTENVRYGIAGVDHSSQHGASSHRSLMLDIYEPENDLLDRPALVLAFGGAFQRGTRKDDVVGEPPNRNTAISEYCREFARRGYVCFSIDYRLMPEKPDPGTTPTWISGTTINVDRANFVRNLLGLEPCTQQMMIDEIEAATDDVSAAVSFVRSRCHSLRIDPDRIALGGFSAGATIAINSAYAENSPVAAVIALSGRMSIQAAETYVRDGNRPPLLMIFGENDLAGTLEDLDSRTHHFREIGLRHDIHHIRNATHFYPRASEVLRADGSRTDIEGIIAEFLADTLRLSPDMPDPSLIRNETGFR